MVDTDAPPHPLIILTMLGEFEIPEVTLPLLNIPAMPLPSWMLEVVSGTSDPLVDLATVVLLVSTPGSTPAKSTIASSSASAGFFIAQPLVPSTTPPAATVPLSILLAISLVPLLVPSLPAGAEIPAAQSASFFAAAIPRAAFLKAGLFTAPIHAPVLAELMKRQLVNWVIAGATEAVGKGKTIRKVAPSILISLAKPPYEILADMAEGLI